MSMRNHKRAMRDENPAPPWPVIAVAALSLSTVALILTWVLNAPAVNHWLGVHTGTVNESGPYYGFWSGFGSDIAEFGILGAIGTAIYQVVKKYNCHEPGCWRVGTHPAAGGDFLLCYRHHPDYHGSKPTHDFIVRMHRQHTERQAAMHDKLHEVHRRIAAPETDHEKTVNGLVRQPG
jgi:hypothetical protein